MRFYTNEHTYYCGIDLHVENMFLCIVDCRGAVLLHKNIKTEPEQLLLELEPYRDGLVVGCECMYTWYWLADVCAAENIDFVLGHALYMKAIHGGKSKNDKLDSLKLAMMLKGGMFPMSYVYPRNMRSTRDLMRRRLFFVNKRAELLAHVQMTHHQYNLQAPSGRARYRANKNNLKIEIEDPTAKRMVESDYTMIEHYTSEIMKLEWYIKKNAEKTADGTLALNLLKTMPGIGDVLSLTILYEVEDIERFPSVQKFCSYSRLVKPEKTSAGKKAGSGGSKIGNPHLKWAFSEAAALMLRNEQAKQYMKRLTKKHPKPKAMSILSHRIGKAAYFILKHKEAFSENKFYA